MVSRKITEDDLSNPSGILSNLLNDYIERRFDQDVAIKKAVVVSVDLVGGQLSSEEEPLNPKNSIKAKVLDDGIVALSIEDIPVFWPMFSHDTMPIKPGEHVYVIYDSIEGRSGVWISRAPEPLRVGNTAIDNKNYVDGIAKYLADENNEITEISAQRRIQGSEQNPEEILLPEEFSRQAEPTPTYTARIGDRVIDGSHNSIIILGRDRITDTTTGIPQDSGDIRLVAGRTTENVDINTDNSTILITQQTDIDVNTGLDGVGQNKGPSASIAIKSDEIRISARNGMKIIVDDTPDSELYINAPNVIIGDGNSDEEPNVLGDTLVEVMGELIDEIGKIIVPTGVGPSGPPNNAPKILAIKTKLQNFLSKTVKSKP